VKDYSSKEAYESFWACYDKHASQFIDCKIRELTFPSLTQDWFERNLKYYDFDGRRSVGTRPVDLIVTSSLSSNKDSLFRFFETLYSIFNNENLSIDHHDIRRFIDPNLSTEWYFEIRMLDLLSRSGFSIERDVKTHKSMDVDARINFGNWSALVDCKRLNFSQESNEFYEFLEQFNAFLVTQRIEKGLCICGELIFKRHFGWPGWYNIFEMTKASIEKGQPYMCECDDFSYKVAPSPDFEFQTFKTSEPMPENDRIKRTLNKMLTKLKGTDGGTLICCIPPESGQGSALEVIDQLLKKNKYKKIHNVIGVDIRDTFEDEYLIFRNRMNPNYEYAALNWNDDKRIFQICK